MTYKVANPYNYMEYVEIDDATDLPVVQEDQFWRFKKNMGPYNSIQLRKRLFWGLSISIASHPIDKNRDVRPNLLESAIYVIHKRGLRENRTNEAEGYFGDYPPKKLGKQR